jgi:hypothetical protein
MAPTRWNAEPGALPSDAPDPAEVERARDEADRTWLSERRATAAWITAMADELYQALEGGQIAGGPARQMIRTYLWRTWCESARVNPVHRALNLTFY